MRYSHFAMGQMSAPRRLVETLGPEGLIAAPDQDMIGDVPTENVAALFDPALRGLHEMI